MNLLQMLVGRPVITLFPVLNQNPVIGFGREYVDPGQEGKFLKLKVKDYVSNTEVFVLQPGTLMFTKQRYEVVVNSNPVHFIPFMFFRGLDKELDTDRVFSNLHVKAQLEINGFWRDLEEYEKGLTLTEEGF